MALDPRQQRFVNRRATLNSMAIPDMNSFTPEQLQQYGRQLGDESAFTTHPDAKTTWESNIRRGNIRDLNPMSTQSLLSGMPAQQTGMQGPGGVTTQIGQGADYNPSQAATSYGMPNFSQTSFGEGYGLKGAEAALLGGQSGAESVINAGYGQAADIVQDFGQRAGQGLQPYADQGAQSSQRQAALSGALGPEAQAQAYAEFESSPGQDYLRGQAEKALLRNSAAIGGLGGGNVRSALQEQAVGLAAQDFDNSFNRMSGVTDRGFNAAQLLSGIEAGVGDRLSNLTTEGAGTVAGMRYGTGGNLASFRNRAGETMAGQYGNTSSQLAQIQQQFGGQLAQQLGQTGGNLAQLLGGAGQSDAQFQQQLAALLANISTGSGSQVAALPGIPGTQQTNGILPGLIDLAGGVGGAIDWYSNRGA